MFHLLTLMKMIGVPVEIFIIVMRTWTHDYGLMGLWRIMWKCRDTTEGYGGYTHMVKFYDNYLNWWVV